MSSKINKTDVSPIMAGILCKCPSCGKGRLFSNFLSLEKECNVCKLDYGFADSGDGPAVFIIFIVGFIIVGGTLFVELSYQPPYWVHIVIWFPLTLFLFFRSYKAIQSNFDCFTI